MLENYKELFIYNNMAYGFLVYVMDYILLI